MFKRGAVAQLVEHLLCKQGVSGSTPLSSTKNFKGSKILNDFRPFFCFCNREDPNNHQKQGPCFDDCFCVVSFGIIKIRDLFLMISSAREALHV